MRDLGEAERDLAEHSFLEFGSNSIIIKVMVVVLLIIHYYISLQNLSRYKISYCNI